MFSPLKEEGGMVSIVAGQGGLSVFQLSLAHRHIAFDTCTLALYHSSLVSFVRMRNCTCVFQCCRGGGCQGCCC